VSQLPVMSADNQAVEGLVQALLPLAASLEADHWRVFLAVCEEDGISLQKLGRLTGLGQSEVIRATSVLENWSAAEEAQAGLLYGAEEAAKGYRRSSYLTPAGKALRDMLHKAFGAEDYAESAFGFHQFLQQELAQQWQQAA
jgi:hypothetical protein